MAHTYYWWESDEANYWHSNYYTDIPLLEGIKLSPETKKMYEGIYYIVQNNTNNEDSIFCFPQISSIYALCDRRDPGLFSKVQWFDVVTASKLQKDMNVIKEKMPKIIIIYNVQENVYKSHEKLFNNGRISATRQMRDELLMLTTKYYSYNRTFQANHNSVTVYMKK